MSNKEHEITYFDPNGCANGHTNVYRYHSTGACLQCNRQYAKENRERRSRGLVALRVRLPKEQVETLKQVVSTLGGEVL